MKKLLTIFTLATLSMNAFAMSDTSKKLLIDASERFSMAAVFEHHCSWQEDVYLTEYGKLYLSELKELGLDVKAFFSVEWVNVERLIQKEGQVVACAKLKQRLKNNDMFYLFKSTL